ncbi:hypothetical protein [Bacillus safensis]|uniref:hypothetical protein n=1 Tax=Bacillus safensis TaxID=561879 RepID=UPI0022AA106E|nr:hypothetical protein [Bacillus safensis]MCZ2740042.1 hypothetical protein [Bacillus safensis]
MSMNEQEIYEDKILEWIEDHFVMNEVEIEDYPFLLHGKLIRDKQGETMVILVCDLWACRLPFSRRIRKGVVTHADVLFLFLFLSLLPLFLLLTIRKSKNKKRGIYN